MSIEFEFKMALLSLKIQMERHETVKGENWGILKNVKGLFEHLSIQTAQNQTESG